MLTRNAELTAYEDHTIVLPCEVLNLPTDMHIIWQYSRQSREDRSGMQTVLTIGKTQIENNYRVRVISNSSDSPADTDSNKDKYLNHLNELITSQALSSSDSDRLRVTSNSLEIRKLQVTDSGWYECQLPTKPTQKTYVHLQVFGKQVLYFNKYIYTAQLTKQQQQ